MEEVQVVDEASDFYRWERRHNDLMVFSKTVLPNERTCSVLYTTLDLSAIYAASSLVIACACYYKTGLNRVVHFTELVNTYI